MHTAPMSGLPVPPRRARKSRGTARLRWAVVFSRNVFENRMKSVRSSGMTLGRDRLGELILWLFETFFMILSLHKPQHPLALLCNIMEFLHTALCHFLLGCGCSIHYVFVCLFVCLLIDWLNSLGWHCPTKPYRFPVNNSTERHLHKSPSVPSGPPVVLFYRRPPLCPPAITTLLSVSMCLIYIFFFFSFLV